MPYGSHYIYIHMQGEEETIRNLTSIATTHWLSASIAAFLNHNLNSYLSEGPKSLQEMTDYTGTVQDKLFRLLRFLVHNKIIDYSEETNKYSQNNTTVALEKVKWHFIVNNSTSHTYPFSHLTESLKSNEPALKYAFKEKSIFQVIQEENLDDFNNFMEENTIVAFKMITETINFDNFESLLDVGGCNRSLIKKLANTLPNKRFGVFDLEHNRQPALENCGEFNERIQFHSGNFFESVTPGYDAILMKNVIHDWNDEECEIILRNCSSALQGNSFLYICEYIIGRNGYIFNSNVYDILMMTIVTGRERTLDEYKVLLERSGFEFMEIYEDPTGYNLIKAKKA